MPNNSEIEGIKCLIKQLRKNEQTLSYRKKGEIVAQRLLQGWAFLGTSKEEHQVDVLRICEITRQLLTQEEKRN